ncbi:MAG TPA: hypothetical protein VFD69_22165 [Vicinamibacterales bacterium]|nr:hypothetical protein [Vicinamibacterales bacterium]
MTARMLTMAAVAVLTMGCGDDDSPTSPTDTTPATTAVTYAGTLDVGGSRFYSFTNGASGSVTAFLASVASPDTRLPLTLPLEIGIGVPAGTGCALTTAQIVAPGLVSQMSASLPAGVFCLRVADAGDLRGPVTFAVRFSHP